MFKEYFQQSVLTIPDEEQSYLESTLCLGQAGKKKTKEFKTERGKVLARIDT
jgi:hypothetical protein